MVLHKNIFKLINSEEMKRAKRSELLLTKKREARHPCLMPVILATWEAEIKRIMVQGQSRANSS
jgi:hypothetical protein